MPRSPSSVLHSDRAPPSTVRFDRNSSFGYHADRGKEVSIILSTQAYGTIRSHHRRLPRLHPEICEGTPSGKETDQRMASQRQRMGLAGQRHLFLGTRSATRLALGTRALPQRAATSGNPRRVSSTRSLLRPAQRGNDRSAERDLSAAGANLFGP